MRRVIVSMVAASVVWGVGLAPGAASQRVLHKLTHFERIEGLPHHSVLAITQDRQGFIWLGTADGLVRYDGYEFVVYRHDTRDSTSLSHNTVTALLDGSDGRLWVGTEGGLNALDPVTGRFTRHALGPSGGVIGVQALFAGEGGAVWVGAACGLLRYDPEADRETFFGCRAGGDPGPAFYRHVRGRQGRFWAGTSQRGPLQGLYRFVPETREFVRFALPETWRPERAVSVVAGPSGRIWVGTPHHAVGWFDVAARRFEQLPIEGGEVWLEDRDGGLWIELQESLARYGPASGRLMRFELDPGDPGSLARDVRAVFEDRAGTVWVGTLGGLFRYDPDAPFRHLRHDADDPNSLSSNTVMAIHEDADSTLWVGTLGGGLNRIDADGAVTRFRHQADDAGRLCHDDVWAVHRDAAGILWIGTDGGLCRFDSRARSFVPYPLPAEQPYVNSIAEDVRGDLWIGGEWLYRVPSGGGRAERFAPDRETSELFRNVQAVYPAADGVVWLGTEFSGLWRLDVTTGRFHGYPVAGHDGGLLGRAVRVIHPSTDGRSLWLGTDLGLVHFDLGTETFEHYLEREGLPGSNVFGILEDEQARLWVSTNQGLARLDPEAGTIHTFTAAASTGNIEYNRRAAVVGPTGVFYFGGLAGITAFRPDHVSDGAAPPVAITHVQKAGRSGTLELQPAQVERDGLVVRPHEQAFAFEFAALSFTHPGQNRYVYRLEGFDESWVEAGTRRYARYAGVPPGRFTFRVRGGQRGGPWHADGAAVQVTVLPALWQTGWFQALGFALALGLLWAGYRYRVAHLLREERLRLRIASDLHDDVGSKLSTIALMTDVLGRRDAFDEAARRQLTEVSDVARRMADDLRDIVWLINPHRDGLEDLVAKMQHLAATMLDDTVCTFRCPSDAFTETLGTEQRRQLFLIYKELLHNVARHARADHVTIVVERRDGALLLEVCDDGVGFDPAVAHAGTGLQSVRQRAHSLGGELSIESRLSEGTVARLTVEIAKSRDGLFRR